MTRTIPILFSAPMVRALLDDRKMMTRRILKPQPRVFRSAGPFYRPHSRTQPSLWQCLLGSVVHAVQHVPYAPDDLLYVREAWRTYSLLDDAPPSEIRGLKCFYEADPGYKPKSRYRQAMHMPREMSRLTLRVTGVRVERLQDISEADAVAEGVEQIDEFPAGTARYRDYSGTMSGTQSPIKSFRTLWDSLNGDRPGCSWSDNPWICAISFDVIKANVDQVIEEAAA